MYISKYTEKEMESILIEMNALVKFCETTDCRMVRNQAKQRLRELSDIPDINPHGPDILIRQLYV